MNREARRVLLVFVFILGCIIKAESKEIINREVSDTVAIENNKNGEPKKTRLPTFLSAKFSYGAVFNTNDFVSEYGINQYKAASLKFAIASLGNRWQDIAYGMPYVGLGVQVTDFQDYRNLGRPVSLYVFQGATITRISPRLLLNYELNLGVSVGWKPYDAFDNPDNVAIGSSVNIQVGLTSYLKWMVSRDFDLNVGVEVGHFSNGASRMPNKGINIGGVFIGAAYNFNRKYVEREYSPDLIPPIYRKKWVSDFLVNISSRQETVGNADDKRPSKYIDRNFTVLGFSYALLRMPNYRYRYGLGADLIYDESAGVVATRELNPHDGEWYDRVKKGRVRERVAFGLSAKGEIMNPGYSIFANIGYDIIHGNKLDHRFYQVVGIKVYLKDNFFGTFGIRATHFSSAQFLYWSLGYTLDHSPTKKHKTRKAALM